MATADRTLPGSERRVQLMATCLCDAFFDDTARASVEVLEHLGCAVDFPDDQTCCGQPALNAGDWPAARKVVRHTLATFRGDTPIVTPSASCASMLRHAALLAFEHEPDLDGVRRLAGRVWELSDFIVHALGVAAWRGRLDAAVALHRSCHSRGSTTGTAARALLESITGIRLVEFGEDDQCCGFGGTFSVSFPHISASMGSLKLEHVRAAAPDLLVSTDMSCLMHLAGLADRQDRPIPTRHIAQVLRDSLAGHPTTS